MRIVEVRKTFEQTGITLEAGHRYVLAEDIECQYRSLHGDDLGLSYPIESIYRPYKGEDLNGKRLMAWRTGGIGDMMFLLPVIQYLKKKYPQSFIRVASGCKQPLENVPAIDELYDMPFDAKLLEDVDLMLQFQGIIESSSDASKKTHAVDMFFSYFSIDSLQIPAEEKRPKLFFTNEEMDWLKKTLPSMGIAEDNYVIGLQMETSSPLRNYPKEKFKAVIDLLAQEEKVKIVLIGTDVHEIIAQFYKGNNPNIIPALKFSVRQSIVLANRYNLVIAPDSFMIQTAGALEKPLIGLYGPFPSEVRMKYFKNAIGLDPSVVCSPCFKHDFRACIKGFPSPCFSLLTIEDILQAADYFKHKFTGKHFFFMKDMLKDMDLSEVEKYLLSADKGLCFFGGYYRHPNMITVDPSPFAKTDISDLNSEFKRDAYPFVVYTGPGFNPKHRGVFDGSKGLVRPGGYYIVYVENSAEQFFTEVKRNLGESFIILYSRFDTVKRFFVIVGKKQY